MYTEKGAMSGMGAVQTPTQQNNQNQAVLEVDAEEEEDHAKPLGERVLNSKWRVRLEAFKEINRVF